MIGQLIMGALIGFVASIIMKQNDQMGFIKNIAAGLIGSFVGGLIPVIRNIGPSLLGMRIVPALIGACIVVFIASALFGKKDK
ncbi:MAG: GlsB/YeaQ/YmgE family stress response membrane protein [Streptococcaceae bacterium]|jgi:uncharacterized membrane protein YeaQ/YmgE (transglycosylase-associated protein family)|nr:GlsB/YeaQ/YmgE family stress response membrane protein [Streptococcaceae bacterium]